MTPNNEKLREIYSKFMMRLTLVLSFCKNIGNVLGTMRFGKPFLRGMNNEFVEFDKKTICHFISTNRFYFIQSHPSCKNNDYTTIFWFIYKIGGMSLLLSMLGTATSGTWIDELVAMHGYYILETMIVDLYRKNGISPDDLSHFIFFIKEKCTQRQIALVLRVNSENTSENSLVTYFLKRGSSGMPSGVRYASILMEHIRPLYIEEIKIPLIFYSYSKKKKAELMRFVMSKMFLIPGNRDGNRVPSLKMMALSSLNIYLSNKYNYSRTLEITLNLRVFRHFCRLLKSTPELLIEIFAAYGFHNVSLTMLEEFVETLPRYPKNLDESYVARCPYNKYNLCEQIGWNIVDSKTYDNPHIGPWCYCIYQQKMIKRLSGLPSHDDSCYNCCCKNCDLWRYQEKNSQLWKWVEARGRNGEECEFLKIRNKHVILRM